MQCAGLVNGFENLDLKKVAKSKFYVLGKKSFFVKFWSYLKIANTVIYGKPF